MTCDPDPSLLKLKPYLATLGVFLHVKRGPRKLGLLGIGVSALTRRVQLHIASIPT